MAHQGTVPLGLLTVARRRAIDRIRRLSASRKESLQRELVTQLMDRDEEAETDQRSSLTSGCASSLLAAIPPWVLMRKLP
jgi:DNA-directed RNA polymerase specialized sigma24 family protein